MWENSGAHGTEEQYNHSGLHESKELRCKTINWEKVRLKLEGAEVLSLELPCAFT